MRQGGGGAGAAGALTPAGERQLRPQCWVSRHAPSLRSHPLRGCVLRRCPTQSDLGLNIREAHAFNTSDGFSLDVFVVDQFQTEVRAACQRLGHANDMRHSCTHSTDLPPLPSCTRTPAAGRQPGAAAGPAASADAAASIAGAAAQPDTPPAASAADPPAALTPPGRPLVRGAPAPGSASPAAASGVGPPARGPLAQPGPLRAAAAGGRPCARRWCCSDRGRHTG